MDQLLIKWLTSKSKAASKYNHRNDSQSNNGFVYFFESHEVFWTVYMHTLYMHMVTYIEP